MKSLPENELLPMTKYLVLSKGLMALGFVGNGAVFIFYGVCDYFPILNALGPGAWLVGVAPALFFGAIGLEGSRRFYRKEFFRKVAESAERTGGQQQDGAGEESNHNG
jgi:hypothetical protein